MTRGRRDEEECPFKPFKKASRDCWKAARYNSESFRLAGLVPKAHVAVHA